MSRNVVIAVACTVDPDIASVIRWFDADPICSCGGLTAHELVDLGRCAEVIRFLQRIGDAS